MPKPSPDESARFEKRRNSNQSTDDALAEKRRRLRNESTSRLTRQETGLVQPSKQLSHDDYTIAWICALPLELKAAQLMLDEEHKSLPVAESDHNVYTLGSMAGHNVAITCLPAGVYGLTSATAVGQALKSTFPKATLVPLLVGIGGSAPSSKDDIRLGDVVVGIPTSESPAIKQYDLGKTGLNGQLEVKGVLNKPAPVLLTAVTNIQAKSDLTGSQIREYISRIYQQDDDDEFEYPGADLDVLHEPECEHILNGPICSTHGPLKSLDRTVRLSPNPKVHFGTIASGNQVIKHARTRDQLAQAHQLLCFETEAAGLMDYLPCLVIRGISDYCDSFKNDQFQPYAALTAAAFAKGLLSVMPLKKSERMPDNTISNGHAKAERRRLIIEALDFAEAESRRATIKKAHAQTCKWLFQQKEYLDWQDLEKLGDFEELAKAYGLLWIKGNPGTGKSTIMKFVLEELEKNKSKEDILISFFFNARGELLEKSVTGLYRSLIVQLLKQIPALECLLDNIKLPTTTSGWDLEHLMRLFKNILQTVSDQRITCLIDALDECPEEEIRQMVDFFEETVSFIAANHRHIRILFSSRHYPHVSINSGQEFVLENQNGHAQDLVSYVRAELKIGKSKQAEKLREEIVNKANSIFLWVVLVVRILKQEYDRGRVHDMAQRLKDIPVELNELFKDILLRDDRSLPELVLCIQWILFSKRSLKREEFYFAMLAGNDNADVAQWDQEEATFRVMDKFILDCSKGLAEVTRGKKPTVQFIHESVREFLLIPNALSDLWHGFKGITQAESHHRLQECCNRLVSSTVLEDLDLPDDLSKANDPSCTLLREKLDRLFPFLTYAVSFLLYHANEAENRGGNQSQFLRNFNGSQWLKLYNMTRRYQSHRRLAYPIGFWQHLASENLQQLVRSWFHLHQPEKSEMKVYAERCLKYGDSECHKVIICEYLCQLHSLPRDLDFTSLKNLFDSLSSPDVGRPEKHTIFPRGLTDLALRRLDTSDQDVYRYASHSARLKDIATLEVLLDAEFKYPKCSKSHRLEPFFEAVCAVPEYYSKVSSLGGTKEMLAARSNLSLEEDARACIELLVSRGLQLETLSFPCQVLSWATLDFVLFLLHRGCQCPSLHDIVYSRPSSTITQTKLILSLVQAGADVNAEDAFHQTPLHLARSLSSTRLLLESGAQVNAEDQDGETPLHHMARGGKLKSVVELLNYGADINYRGSDGQTALHCAIFHDRALSFLTTLLHRGADVNAKDSDGDTPLCYWAQAYGSNEDGYVLFNHGADPDLTWQRSGTFLNDSFRAEIIEKMRTMKAQVPCCQLGQAVDGDASKQSSPDLIRGNELLAEDLSLGNDIREQSDPEGSNLKRMITPYHPLEDEISSHYSPDLPLEND